jgi:branched-chain amino acid transport system permease protein
VRRPGGSAYSVEVSDVTMALIESAESRPTRRARRTSRGLAAALILGLLAWLTWNFLGGPEQFVSVALDGLSVGALYALIALGYTLVYGIIGLINFAHGDLFMLASVFSSIVLVSWLGADTGSLRNWLLMVAVLAGVMLACAGINAASDVLAYRRLRRAPKLAALITSVGLSFAFRWLGLQLNGPGQRVWPTIIPSGGIGLGTFTLGYSTIVVTAVTVPLLLALIYVVRYTRRGKAMRATSQDRDAATLMGVNVDRTIAFTFALGGALAGAAGLLYFETLGDTNYSGGAQFGLIAFTGAVLGGVGNLLGAVIGGYLIGLIQAFNDGLPHGLGQEWSQSVVFAVLILLLVLRPEGILGRRTVENV